MKKIACLLFLLAALLPASLQAEITPVFVTPEVSLNKTEMTLLRGETDELEPDVTGTEQAAVQVKWTSSNPGVASVKNGVVTAKKAGEAEVTCTVTLAGGEKLEAACTVSVGTPVKKLAFAAAQVSLFLGETSEPLKVKVTPSGACQDVTFSSSDEKIATVDAEGRVTGVSAGKAVITATSGEISTAKAKTAAMTVSVRRKVESITVSSREETVACAQTVRLSASAAPEDASNRKVTWKSSDPRIADVSKTGVVTGKRVGTCVITCTAADGSGASDACTVNVIRHVTGVYLPVKELNLAPGDTRTVEPTVRPDNACDKTVTWSTSDEKVAAVDETGKITAVGAGHCFVTAVSADNPKESRRLDVYVK